MFGIKRHALRSLEKKIGYSFKKKSLLETALVHRSYRFESDGIEKDNQRLEFLGDAVLGLVTAAVLFKLHSDSDEGILTCIRSRLTSGKALASIGKDLGLGDEIKLGKGEERSGGRTRSSNITDALEAILGAAYIDGGLKAVEKIFRKVFMPVLAECDDDLWAGNPKGRLQEHCQRELKASPRYKQVSATGPSHARSFTVEVCLHGEPLGKGKGASKREAETNAAKDALRKLSTT